MSTGTLIALIVSTLAMGAAVGSFLFLYRTNRRVATKLSVRDRLHRDLVARIGVLVDQVDGTSNKVSGLLSDIQQFAAELESAGRDRGLILERIRTLESDRTALRSDIRELSELVTRQSDRMVTDFEGLIERVQEVELSRTALSRELRELRAVVEAAHFGQPNMPTEPSAELSLRDTIDTLPN